jgi:hypothetical protein
VRLLAHFSLDQVEFGKESLVGVESHIEALVIMSEDIGSVIKDLTAFVFGDIDLLHFVLKEVIVQKLHVHDLFYR